MYFLAMLLIVCTRAEFYNTRVRRSIWISTPSGVHYQSQIIPTHNPRAQVFIPYQRDSRYDIDDAYPLNYRQGTRLNKTKDYRDDEEKSSDSDSKHKHRSWMERVRSGLYDALFGGGIARVFVYIVVAALFAVIGYQVRKNEEYGSYVRLPAEEH